MTEKKITISDYYYKKTEIDNLLDNKANKTEIPTKTSNLTNDSGFLTQHQNISGKEDTSNKVTSLSSSSTDTQYPSAKAVYDAIPSDTVTLTATLEDGTIKTYVVYGEEINKTDSSIEDNGNIQGGEIDP